MTERPSLSAPIVKLGGSLFGARALDALLDVVARRGVLIVAGGGPFADAVRTAQQRFGFDDAAAHRMALLAMDQGACLLAARRPDFALCATPEQIEAAAGRPAIWWPSAMALAANVPHSWDVTSDSLALWLAIETRAPSLTLVKSASTPADGDAEAWAAAGLVDGYLPALAARYRGALACVGDACPAALERALSAPPRIAA